MEATTWVESAPEVDTRVQWSTTARIAFRFCFVYFVLFCLSGQILTSIIVLPKIEIPELGTLWPVRQIVFWTGAHVFGLKTPLVYSGSGSGDKQYDWVLLFCILAASVLATAIWPALDRKRDNYQTLQKWFLLFLRVGLVSQMLIYGFIKAFPLQMPYPGLGRLVEQFGDFSPMNVLWSSVGAAPAYETIVGCAELLGGVLLMFPRTVMLGALVCLGDMVEVFLLNMTYDVPVKLLSFHLILISFLLLAPDMKRMANFVLNRATEPAPQRALFSGRRAQRIAAGVIAFLWIWLAGNNAYGVWQDWHRFGPAASKSPLYGIWDIKDYLVHGEPQPLLLTNAQEWRGIVFDYPTYAEVQQMIGSRGFGAALDGRAHTVTLTARDDKHWQAHFTYSRPAFDRLTLDGTMNGQHVTLHLQRVDEKKFLLEARGFHWVQDYPFNR